MEDFLPIVFLLFFALIIAVAIFTLSHLLGPKRHGKTKESAYECGVRPEGNAQAPFRTSFYLVAVLFLLFDVEAAFFLPWALVYRESIARGPELLIAISVYLGLLLIGLLYVFKKDCLRLND